MKKNLFTLDMLKSNHQKDRQTLGSFYNKTLEQSVEYFHDDEDMIKKMSDPEKMENDLWHLVDQYKKIYPGRDGFIEMATMRDKLMPRWAKRIMVARYSCPDPWFDQSVWRYVHKDDELEYMWTLPDPETCQLYLKHQDTICTEEQWLLKHILDCKEGKLDAWAKKLNGEKKDSVHILFDELPKITNVTEKEN